MHNNHWFIDAIAELVEEQKNKGAKNALLGLRTAIEVFCMESNFDDKQVKAIHELMFSDAADTGNAKTNG